LGRGRPPGRPMSRFVESATEPAGGPAVALGGRPTKPKQLLALAILATRNFALVGVFAALIVALRQKAEWRWALWVLASGWVAGVALIGSTTRNIPMFWHHFGVQPREVWITAACVIALAIVVWLSARLVPAALVVLLMGTRWWTGLPYFTYDHPPADEWYQFSQQVKEKTSRDAVFITPPFLGGFQLFAERAEVANFKCVPLIETDLVEWKKRLEDLSGTADLRCSGWVDCGSKLAGGYFGLKEPDFRRLARKYGAQYIVT